MITEFSQHEADRGEFEEGEGISVAVLPVLGQPAASVQPGDGALGPGLDGVDGPVSTASRCANVVAVWSA